MTCSNCGNQIDTVLRFCPQCGAPVQLQSPPPQPAGSPYTAPYTPLQSGMPPMMRPPMPLPPRRSSGCGKIILILAIILVILGAGVTAAIYYGYRYTERTLKSSEAYTVALTALKENAEVKEQLGDIQETGFPLGAYSQDANGSGKAAFVMSVKGSKGSGQYQVELTRRNSVWRIDSGVVKTTSGDTIRVVERRGLEDVPNANANANTGDETGPGVISGGLLNAKAISLPKPTYPAVAKAAKASGVVTVRVLVDENGNVISARPVSGHPLLQAAAVAAARGAKFAPTKLSGKRVKVSGILTFTFTPE
jgi:TonB family protein